MKVISNENIRNIVYDTQENLQNYQKTAQENNIYINNETVKDIFEIANRRGVKVSYSREDFSSTKQNALEQEK